MTTSTQQQERLLQENAQLRQEVNSLKEQVAWFTRQIFGQRSEKIIPNERQLEFPELEIPPVPPAEKQPVAACERRKPNRDGKDAISLPSNLVVERQVIDIPEEEKICKETGEALIKIGEEVTRKLAHKPGSYYIKEIVRPKYALPKNSEGGIRTAELPTSLLTRCLADETFLADILVKKFGDHLPIYRISEILGRENIVISRQVLCQWILKAGHALKPLYNEMAHIVLQSGNVFIDEIPLPMLEPGKGKTHQAYMWVIVGGKEADPPYRIYNFRTSREHSHAVELLKGFQGFLHSDKYGAYETLAAKKQFTWCPCWVHIRRKFFEESGDPEFRKLVLRKIRHLFLLERVAWSRSPEERVRIRKDKEAPIIDELTKAIKDRLIEGKALPKSKFREALGYYCGLIPYLKNYTLDPWARLDNNVAERAVRPLAIGRKNWLFVGNEGGGEAAGVILTLIQTCRALGVNPREYLEYVMPRLMDHNSQKLHELLPDQWAKTRQKI